MGAKQTSQLIPLCHNIPLDKVDVALTIDDSRQTVDILATAKTQAYTGKASYAMYVDMAETYCGISAPQDVFF